MNLFNEFNRSELSTNSMEVEHTLERSELIGDETVRGEIINNSVMTMIRGT
ncbi:MAG: hypothetical protein E6344_15405 [Clostridium sp.]|nr:hypothetical protein [Clostridium sp.]MDU7085081.1 hypothetical protein [Clostridium sp.]